MSGDNLHSRGGRLDLLYILRLLVDFQNVKRHSFHGTGTHYAALFSLFRLQRLHRVRHCSANKLLT